MSKTSINRVEFLHKLTVFCNCVETKQAPPIGYLFSDLWQHCKHRMKSPDELAALIQLVLKVTQLQGD